MANNYDKILDATLELVNERSYHGASTTMIAERVNISKSTVFYYFKSKEGILLALFEEAGLTVNKQVRSIVDDKNLTGKEKLKKWTHSYLDNLETVGDIIKVYLRESRFISDKSRAIFKKRQRVYVGLIVKIIEQIQNEDEQAFKNLDPKFVARSILGMYNSVSNWFDHKGKISTEELAEMIYEMISGSFQKSKTAPNKNLGPTTELQTVSSPAKSITQNLLRRIHIKPPGRYRLSKQSVPTTSRQPRISNRVPYI